MTERVDVEKGNLKIGCYYSMSPNTNGSVVNRSQLTYLGKLIRIFDLGHGVANNTFLNEKDNYKTTMQTTGLGVGAQHTASPYYYKHEDKCVPQIVSEAANHIVDESVKQAINISKRRRPSFRRGLRFRRSRASKK